MVVKSLKKRIAAFAAAGVMATALAMPAVAFADYPAEPEVTPMPENATANDSGQNSTDLYLQYQDANKNLADWAATVDNCKVQIPVALNYVVRPGGAIEGPTTAAITNYSGYAVRVSNIQVTESQQDKVSIVSSLQSGILDTVILNMTPNNGTEGTLISLADYKADTGTSPTIPADWYMAPKGVSTTYDSKTIADKISLTSLSGTANGFQKLDLNTKQKLGSIAWTIVPGWSA